MNNSHIPNWIIWIRYVTHFCGRRPFWIYASKKNGRIFARDTGAKYFLKGSRKSNQSSKHLSQKVVMKVRFFTLLKWTHMGRGPRVVISTAAFHTRVRGSVPGLGSLKETRNVFPHPRVKVSIVGSLRDREVACSASDRLGSNFESCVWRTVSSQSSHHPQEVLLAQFSLYVHI